MKLNADLSQRACENIHQLQWEDSSADGVQRIRLERDDDHPPVERVTTVVRFAPGSSFMQNVHAGGEEFLVLEGLLSDQYGDYPAGTYGRNPKGSAHAPFSKDGCTMLVKLWQMHPDDQQQVAINTNDQSLWQALKDGSDELTLFNGHYECVSMIRWPKGMILAEQVFEAGVEYFVVEGEFSDQDSDYPKGTWLRLPPGYKQTIHADNGCVVLRKAGHLLNPVTYL
jgi:anti-sigma factor ChrR (cupin superfamily)